MNTTAVSVDDYLQSLSSWQADNISRFRRLVHTTVPDIAEAIKWGVPVFIYHNKTLFAAAAFKTHTKYNFLHNGAQLDDPESLFNSGLESKKSRGIDLHESETVDERALTTLIMQAIHKL